MTDAIETISLIEGLPLGASPSKIMTACKVRRETKRQDKIDISLAIANLILGGFSASSDTLSAVAHMFTEDEMEQLRQEQEDRREIAIQRAQLESLRMKQWQKK